MYQRDNPIIARHMLAHSDNFANGVTFVFTTIQQSLASTVTQMQDIRSNGADSKYLFGSKRDGYLYVQKHKKRLHKQMCEYVKNGDTESALDLLTDVPCLGIVKAAFVAQLCGMDVACIDSHNCDRLGLARTALKLAKTVKPATKLKKIGDYVALCKRTGGSQYWWDTWCEYVAGNNANKKLPTGDAVSAFHVVAVMS